MASEPIHINDDSELPRLLDEAAERPVRFERKGVVYRVSLDAIADDSETWDDWDPEAFRAALDRAAGLYSDEEADEMIAHVYKWRHLDTPLNVKPRWMDDDEWEEPTHPFNKSGGTFTDEEVAASLAWLRERLRLRAETGVEAEWGEESWIAARTGLEIYAFSWDDVDPELVEERYQASQLLLRSRSRA